MPHTKLSRCRSASVSISWLELVVRRRHTLTYEISTVIVTEWRGLWRRRDSITVYLYRRGERYCHKIQRPRSLPSAKRKIVSLFIPVTRRAWCESFVPHWKMTWGKCRWGLWMRTGWTRRRCRQSKFELSKNVFSGSIGEILQKPKKSFHFLIDLSVKKKKKILISRFLIEILT